jgi:signal peptidase I
MRRYLPGLAACALLAALALRQRFTLITVTGDSMMPALSPGDRVLVRGAHVGQLRPGQVVVVEMPGADGYRTATRRRPANRREWMIKRVAAVPGDPRPEGSLPKTAGPPGTRVPPGRFVVLGDNAAWSHDSRQIGYIPGDRLLGIVVRVNEGAVVRVAERVRREAGRDNRVPQGSGRLPSPRVPA